MSVIDFAVPMYVVYLTVSIILTVWVARTLYTNGRIFLVEAFLGNQPLADSVNHLLVVGFYLINLGFVLLALKANLVPTSLGQMIEVLSSKLGMVMLILGGMHFFNLAVFSNMRNRGLRGDAPPPVRPQGYITSVPKP